MLSPENSCLASSDQWTFFHMFIHLEGTLKNVNTVNIKGNNKLLRRTTSQVLSEVARWKAQNIKL